jgi:hypothetical protein
MRPYGRIFVRYWTSPDIVDLNGDSKLLGAYLLSSPHSNMLGCYRLPVAYVVDDLKMGSETVLKGFRNLSNKGFMTHDLDLSWVLIRNFLKWNPIENPNQGKAAAKLFDEVPVKSTVYAPLVQMLRANPANFPDGFIDRFETLSEPYRNQELELELELELDQDQELDHCAALVPIATREMPGVISIPLNDGSEYGILQTEMDEWSELFPAVDVLQQLRNYKAWSLAKPKKRKTRRGIKASITSWLSDKQDRGTGREHANGTNNMGQSTALGKQHRSDDAIDAAVARREFEASGGFDEAGTSLLSLSRIDARNGRYLDGALD